MTRQAPVIPSLLSEQALSATKDLRFKQHDSTSQKGNKVKLLIVAPYFPPHPGGLEAYAFNIAQGLMQTYDYEVVVVTSNPHGKEQIIEDYCGIKVYRLPILLRIANTPINPFWYVTLKSIIRAEKPDIINSHQPVPFIGDLTA